MSRKPNPGSQEAAQAGCNCSPAMNNAGREEPATGWKVRATCPVHGSLTRSESLVAVNPDSAIVSVHLGRWARFKARFKRANVEEPAPPPPAPAPEPSVTIWTDAPVENRAVSVITEEMFDEAIRDIERGFATEDAEEKEHAAIRAMVEEEVIKQLAEAVAPRVQELMQPPKREKSKSKAVCQGHSGHWFSVYGQVGLRSPTCVRCKIPNPRFTEGDRAAWNRYQKSRKKK